MDCIFVSHMFYSVILFSFHRGSAAVEELLKKSPHMQAFGTGRPVHKAAEILGFPDPEVFFNSYLLPQKPVLIKHGGKISPAYNLWTDEYFMNLNIPNFSPVNVQTAKKEERKRQSKQMDFKEFVKTYQDMPYYLVDLLPTFLKKDVILPFSIQCPGITDGNLLKYMIWFSSGGTSSVVHFDETENIHCVYRGTKDFVIVDPIRYKGLVPMDVPEQSYSTLDVDQVDYIKYPGLAKVEYIHSHLEAGDCIYVPHRWIHQVRSYNSSLAVNIWWFHDEAGNTEVNKCNKMFDDKITVATLNTMGYDHVSERAILLQENIADHLWLQSEKYMSTNDFLHIIFPEIREFGEHAQLKQEVALIRGMGKNVMSILDENDDGHLTAQEVNDIEIHKFIQCNYIMSEADSIINSIDFSFMRDEL